MIILSETEKYTTKRSMGIHLVVKPHDVDGTQKGCEKENQNVPLIPWNPNHHLFLFVQMIIDRISFNTWYYSTLTRQFRSITNLNNPTMKDKDGITNEVFPFPSQISSNPITHDHSSLRWK